RIRLFIGSSAPELHNLRWETLRIPDQPAASLLTNENILFSRYLSSLDWRPIRLRTEAALKTLVVIANPSQLAEGKVRSEGRQLMPVDVQGELARARDGLGDIPITSLASGGKATLDNLIAQLHDGYDIL